MDFDGLYPHMMLHQILEGAYWWCDRLTNQDEDPPPFPCRNNGKEICLML